MTKHLPILLILLLAINSCVKKPEPCPYDQKYAPPTTPLTEILAGESDTSLVYLEEFDSSGAAVRNFIFLDSVYTQCTSDRIEIVNENGGNGDIYIKSSSPYLSFCTATYVDSTFKREYVQAWTTKRDSVTKYTSYYEPGAELYEVNPVVYAKKFNEGDLIRVTETFTDEVLIFKRIDRSKLESPVVVDGIHVFEKEITDIKTEHIEYEEDFYLGFKYETEDYLQTGYIHLQVVEHIKYADVKELRFRVHDWGIRVSE